MIVIDWLMQPTNRAPGGLAWAWALAGILAYIVDSMRQHSRRAIAKTNPDCSVCGNPSRGHAIAESGKAWCKPCWARVPKTAPVTA